MILLYALTWLMIGFLTVCLIERILQDEMETGALFCCIITGPVSLFVVLMGIFIVTGFNLFGILIETMSKKQFSIFAKIFKKIRAKIRGFE